MTNTEKSTRAKTRAQQRSEALEKHYLSLEKLAILCGLTDPDGKKLSLKLLKIEKEMSKAATQYCNGEIDHLYYRLKHDINLQRIETLFNHKLKGFFINSDPRGYSLKIQDDIFKTDYREQTGLQSDFGGYGILSPDLSIEAFRR